MTSDDLRTAVALSLAGGDPGRAAWWEPRADAVLAVIADAVRGLPEQYVPGCDPFYEVADVLALLGVTDVPR